VNDHQGKTEPNRTKQWPKPASCSFSCSSNLSSNFSSNSSSSFNYSSRWMCRVSATDSGV